jgi:nucleoside-diphosphate-sugar epimerase
MAAGRVIVLGASGFVGRRLVRRLVAQGKAVIALDIVPPVERLACVDYHQHDVCEPIPAGLGDGCAVLYNLAAVHRTPGHPDHEYYDTNLAGSLNAIALAKACAIPTILFSSSISVYGPAEQTVVETSPLRPVSSYGRSKRLAERVHMHWASDDPGRRLIIVRPGVIFGPGEGGNYAQLAKALRKGYFFYPGRRDTIKSGGFVDELLETMDFALGRTDPLIVYNFAFPDQNTTEEIVRTFSEVAGYSAKRVTLPLPALLLAAKLIEAANALGFKSWIHPDRVMKLVQSTRVEPAWLQGAGYAFKSDLKSALTAWHHETDGRFD